MMRCFSFVNPRKKHPGAGTDRDEAGPSHPAGPDDDLEWEADDEEATYFDVTQLRAATDNFHPSNLLGSGGFGSVYKGYLEPDCPLAIKQLNRQGIQSQEEFKNQILRLSRLNHPNLVKQYAYCTDGNEKLLVHEFMAEGSLESHLFDVRPDRQPLEWNTRVKIAIDAARGLTYLHDIAGSPVLHGDLKSANILLDDNFNAKLSDFGLANIFGTTSCAAPEYALSRQITHRSDVYSFGVILLELITGERAHDDSSVREEKSLVVWTKPFRDKLERCHQLADPSLEGRFPQQGFLRLMQLVSLCLVENPEGRIPMRAVVHFLEYLEPTAPSTSGAS